MKVTVNQELVDKLNQLVKIPQQYGKHYFLEIGGFEFLYEEIHPDLKFELEDGDLLFYDGEDLIGDLIVGETVDLEFTITETIITNETKTYFGE